MSRFRPCLANLATLDKTFKAHSSMSQYIGKTISLISNKQLRYVGLLDNINAEDATVSLKSVRSFGTEGRMAQQGQPNMEVMPGTDIYEYVVFRGADVKDLSVLDTPIDQVKPQVAYYSPPPPTATGQQPPATAALQPVTTTDIPSSGNVTTSSAAQAAQRPAAPAETGAPRSQRQPSATSTTSEKPTPIGTSHVPQPGLSPQHQGAPKPSGRPAAPQPGNAPKEGKTNYDTAFDFEEANARFEKEKLEHQQSKPVYDKKSSFFDSISSSTEQRRSMRWNEEKSLNMDTFGQSSVGRGNFRGRGRGGRGRGGRGRGRPETKPEWA